MQICSRLVIAPVLKSSLLFGNRLYRMLMFIVTVKSIDADSFALPTLYGKTTLQNYNFEPARERRKFFRFQQAPRSMSSLRGFVRWLGIYASQSRFVIICPFFLIRNRRFDASQRAKESRPTSWAHRTKRAPLPPVGRASPPSPVNVWRSHTGNLSLNFLLASPPLPLRVIARMLLSLSKYEAIQTSSRLHKARLPLW